MNFVSFFGVILVVARWKRPIRKRTAPPETLTGATVAAIRYVRNSPTILTVVVRTGVVMFFSSALFALLPTVARSVNETAVGYGFLLMLWGWCNWRRIDNAVSPRQMVHWKSLFRLEC